MLSEFEMFQPRGIGENWLRCFVCGSIPAGDLNEDRVSYSGPCQPDMAAFVHCRAAGEVVRQMFSAVSMHAYLDFRPSEPRRVQVKLGACPEHLPQLRRLARLAVEAGNKINPDMLVVLLEG